MDVLCQAKSGMGKTAVFVLSVLQQIEPATPAEVGAIVLCHTRELAYQVKVETGSAVWAGSVVDLPLSGVVAKCSVGDQHSC